MNISCDISLSKKLRSLLDGNDNKILLSITVNKNGIGTGVFSINNDKISTELIGKETSIIITPKEIKEDASNVSAPVTALFNSSYTKKQNTRTAVDKIAVTEPPENEEIPFAVKTKEDISKETPEEFKETKNDEYKNYVSNINELISEINKAKNKSSGIDLDLPEYKENKRKLALATEQKELLESIDKDAYVVNTSCAAIAINDLGVEFKLNIPFNLSKISAKRLIGSRDLFNYIKSGNIKIISPDEVKKYEKPQNNIGNFGLDVFSSAEEAENRIFSASDDRDDIKKEEIGNVDEEYVTEEEKIINMRENKEQGITISGNANKISHNKQSIKDSFRTTSQSKPQESQDTQESQEPQENKRTIKTIKSKF